MDDKKRKILIVGPTASGKSKLAHQIAQKLNLPIISADSRQSYKYLDIGTAKPTPEEVAENRYYNISILLPSEQDNPVSFLNRCSNWEKEIEEPFIYVGGSTLYQRSILFGFDDIPTANGQNLLNLTKLLEEKGVEHLYLWLKEVDPEYLKKMDGMNTQRIIRALDVFIQTGKPFSSFHKDNQVLDTSFLVLCPIIDRELLKKRISERVDDMMNKGLLDELNSILKMGFSFQSPGLQTIGYQEWESYLLNQSSLNDTVELIKTRSWQYAKRQITWLKRWTFVNTVEISDLTNPSIINKIIHHLESN